MPRLLAALTEVFLVRGKFCLVELLHLLFILLFKIRIQIKNLDVPRTRLIEEAVGVY